MIVQLEAFGLTGLRSVPEEIMGRGEFRTAWLPQKELEDIVQGNALPEMYSCGKEAIFRFHGKRSRESGVPIFELTDIV